MRSVTNPTLDRYRKSLKRSRAFQDATYAGKAIRAQKQASEMEMQGMISMRIQAIVDWCDLDLEPAPGDAVTFPALEEEYEVRSHLLLGDGMCRLDPQRIA